MKSRLSAWKFIRCNKKSCFVMMIALALTFMTMYLINFILLSSEESFRSVYQETPKKMAMMDLSWESLGVDPEQYPDVKDLGEAMKKARQKFITDMKSLEGIHKVYYTQVCQFAYSGIVGEVHGEFPLLSPEEIPDYLAHMGATLVEGRLPSGDGEILVDSRIMKNQHMEVGGWFMERIWGKIFTVVGVLESDNFTCAGTPRGGTNSGWNYVVLCDPEHSRMAPELSAIGISTTEYDVVYDVDRWAEMFREDVTSVMEGSLLGILLGVTVFLAVSILVAYVSFMRNRMNEYCLYASIGFSRMDIYGMIMREIGLIFGISILIGGSVCIIAMVILEKCMISPLGLLCRYFYPDSLLRIIAAFTAIIGLLQLPILFTIHRIRTIDLLEE